MSNEQVSRGIDRNDALVSKIAAFHFRAIADRGANRNLLEEENFLRRTSMDLKRRHQEVKADRNRQADPRIRAEMDASIAQLETTIALLTEKLIPMILVAKDAASDSANENGRTAEAMKREAEQALKQLGVFHVF